MIKQADDLFSLIIKIRDDYICQYCKHPVNKYDSATMEIFDCSHFIKRSRFQTRFLEINSIAAHRWCHIEHELDPKKHKEFWINLLGEDVVNELIQISNGDLPIYKSWYGGKQHIKDLRERLKELK